MTWSPVHRNGSRSAASRGQIGAGTILVLIAVLIVAATTAGVLFNVTDSLQSEATGTGAAVESEVKSPLRVAAVTGRVNQSHDPRVISELRIIVAQEGATRAIDLGEATVLFESPDTIQTLEYSPNGPTAETTFGVDPIVDPDGSAPLLDGAATRYAVVIDTPPLSESELLTVTITLRSGATKRVQITVPQELGSETAVSIQ